MTDWTLDYRDRADSEDDQEFLDPSKLLFAKRGDALRLTVENDRSYLKVRVVRAFPLTEPNEFFGLIDSTNGKEIGVLRDLRGIDSQTVRLLYEALNKGYFVPKINKINRISREFGTVYWEVETDRGNRRFVMRGIRDSMHEIEPGRYLVLDIDRNRFEIPQLADMDARSQKMWEKLI